MDKNKKQQYNKKYYDKVRKEKKDKEIKELKETLIKEFKEDGIINEEKDIITEKKEDIIIKENNFNYKSLIVPVITTLCLPIAKHFFLNQLDRAYHMGSTEQKTQSGKLPQNINPLDLNI